MKLSSLLITLVLALGVQPAFAITVTTNSGLTSVPGQCSLRDAITAANANAPVASCAAGVAGLDTIELPVGVEILLTQVDNSVDGPTGLPVVIEALILHGNGSVIRRPVAAFCDADGVYDAGEFRLLSSHAAIEIDSLSFLGGCADHTYDLQSYQGRGGALLLQGSATLRRVTVSDNHSGALAAVSMPAGDLIIEDSLIASNRGNNFGAAALAVGYPLVQGTPATLRMVNSTITDHPTGGIAPVVLSVLEASLTNVTIARDVFQAPSDSGVLFDCISGTACIKVKNSIFSRGINPACSMQTSTDLVALGGNLSNDASCPGFSRPNQAPGLGPLTDNGGPTDTMLPDVGSPTIDAVDDCTSVSLEPVTTDQRGYGRPWDGDGNGTIRCDLGAVEAGSFLVFRNGFEG